MFTVSKNQVEPGPMRNAGLEKEIMDKILIIVLHPPIHYGDNQDRRMRKVWYSPSWESSEIE